MKKLLHILYLSHTFTFSQNLVVNGGFEEIDKCPWTYKTGNYRKILPGWKNPLKKSTPDYFNICSTSNAGVKNFAGITTPNNGNGFAGIIGVSGLGPDSVVLSTDKRNYAEYLLTELKEPLKKDSVYGVSFYYKISSYSMFSFSGLGVAFDSKMPKREKYFLNYNASCYVDSVLDVSTHWKKICFTYKAEGGEIFFIIGRFLNRNKTKVKTLNKKVAFRGKYSNSSYVYLDDVYVGLDKSGCIDVSLELSSADTVKLNRYFDIELLNDSNYFNDIVVKLKDQQSLKIYIKGTNGNSEAIKSSFIKAGVLPKQVIEEESDEEKFKLSFE